MIYIVTPKQYSQFHAQLRSMHRHRYHVFKERMEWDVPTQGDEERDKFDDCDPTYLLRLGTDGEVSASWRFLPTTGPYMLRDVFPYLLGDESPPVSPEILETSRFAVDAPDGRADSLASFNRATSELICGLIEYSLAYGYRQIITACDLRIARLLPRLGCPADSLTKAQRIGTFAALVARFTVRQEVLDRVHAVSGIKGSVVANPEAIGGLEAA